MIFFHGLQVSSPRLVPASYNFTKQIEKSGYARFLLSKNTLSSSINQSISFVFHSSTIHIQPHCRATPFCSMAVASSVEDSSSEYESPRTGFLSYLPASWVPYAELARIDKPVACLYLYFPCIFGTVLAASTTKPLIPPTRLLAINLIFLVGSFLVRCAGCTWNDIVDQEIDRKVSRTRLRPMARKAISTFSALVFTIAQVTIGLCLVALLLPIPCLYYSIPSIFLTALYPYAKRFTHYPQLILGCVFSWGVILAFPALEVDLWSSSNTTTAAGYLFLSCIAWTMVYDTIYAAQDIRDDAKAGVKSPIVRHQSNTRGLLVAAASTQVILLCRTGAAMEATGLFFLSTCLGTAFVLGTMVMRVDLSEPKDCIRWFKMGSFCTGAMTASGFIGEYVVRMGLTDDPIAV